MVFMVRLATSTRVTSMRSLTIFALVSFSLVGACSNSNSNTTPDVQAPPQDIPTAEVASDTPAAPEASMDAGMDVNVPDTGAPMDAADGGDAGGRDASDGAVSDIEMPLNLNGYIRFLNLSRGMGTVRFIARSAPGYVPSYIEATVLEGTSSGYIETLPVSYLVNAYPAPGATAGHITDGGMFPDGAMLVDGALPPSDVTADVPAPDAGVGITEQIQSDVYFRAGCTVILAGSETGTSAQQTNRRLWRISDIPMRVPGSEVGLVRVISAYVQGPPLDVDEMGGTRMARILNYFEPTGFRNLPGGMRVFEVRNNEDGAVLGRNLMGTVTNGYPHTLYLWGNGSLPNRTVDAILTNDYALGVTP